MRLALLTTVAVLLAAGRADTSRSASCLGPRPIVVDVGRIGVLDLSLPVDSIIRRCGPVRDTIAHGDESLDTAFVFSTNGVRVVGRLATIGDEDGDHPFRRSPDMHASWWDVSGSGAELPGGASLSSTWKDLRRIYGVVRASPLNGEIHVSVCRFPRLRITMRDPTYASGHWPSAASLDSVLANVSIETVLVPAREAHDLSDAELRRDTGCPS